MIDRPVDREEARDALERHAFTVTHRHCETCACEVEPDRRIVHSRAGIIGADWNLADVLAFVDRADKITWTDDVFFHDLAVVADGRVITFNVPRPERIR